MGRAAKLYLRLDALEASFREQLAPHLADCAAGRCGLLFCAREFLPASYPRCMPTGLADGLLAQAEEIRELRGLVGEPFVGSWAHQFRAGCRAWADATDHHRGSAQTIARRLLAAAEVEA